MPKTLVVMPSVTPRLKEEALRTMKANTSIQFDVFEYPDDRNFGWMGGCNLGLQRFASYDYIILSNDDILIPSCNEDWLDSMTKVMEEKKDVGALSCLSMNTGGYNRLNVETCAMRQSFEVPYCTFFFVMLRKEAIAKIGLLDEELPGGDDLDYCIRLRDAGYRIGITPQVFIWHHYAQTGKKEYGDYWDSTEHTEKINKFLIRKHGFKKYIYSRYLGEVK